MKKVNLREENEKASNGTPHYVEKWIQKINVMSCFDLPTSTLGRLWLFLCNSSKQETTQSYIKTTVTREPSSHAFTPGETARDLNAFPLLELSLLCCLIVTFVWMSELDPWLLLHHQLQSNWLMFCMFCCFYCTKTCFISSSFQKALTMRIATAFVYHSSLNSFWLILTS